MNTLPPSLLRWRSHTNIILNDIILSMETEKKNQSLLFRRIGSGPVHHHHHLAFFLDMVIRKPNKPYLGLNWPAITRQIQDPMHTDPSQLLIQQGVSLKTRSYTVRFILHSSISVTSSWLCMSCALNNSQTRSQKIFSKEQKGFRDGLSYSTPQKSETKKKGKCHYRASVLSLHILMGWDRGWVMAFSLISSLFWGVEYDRPSLNPFRFSENIFLLLVLDRF